MRRKRSLTGKDAGKILETIGKVLFYITVIGALVGGIVAGIYGAAEEEGDFFWTAFIILMSTTGGVIAGIIAGFCVGFPFICAGLLMQDVAGIRERLDEMGEFPAGQRHGSGPRHEEHKYDDLPDL